MDSHYEDTINFGREEANRMHATTPDPWYEAEKWLRTTSGQEFCDELVWGSVDKNGDAVGGLLRSFHINVNQQNRDRFINLADKLMTTGEA